MRDESREQSAQLERLALEHGRLLVRPPDRTTGVVVATALDGSACQYAINRDGGTET